MKILILLLMSLLVVNCGVEEPTVGESASYESETESTLKKVGKYAAYTAAGVGVIVCVTAGLKDNCVRVVKKTFAGTAEKKAVKDLVEKSKGLDPDKLTKAHKKAQKIMDKVKDADDAAKKAAGDKKITVERGERDFKESIFGVFSRKGGKGADEGAEAGAKQ